MYLSCLKIDSGESGGVETNGSRWLANRYRVHQRLCMAFPSKARLQADPDFLAPFASSDFPLLGAEAVQSKRSAGVQQLAQVHAPRDQQSGFLFRIDRAVAGTQVIVQSASVPNWAYAFANFRGVLAAEPQVREFVPSLFRSQRLQFRLEANPTRRVDTKSSPDGVRRHGRRLPVSAPNCVDWLRRFEVLGGFSVAPQEVRLDCGAAMARKSSGSTDSVSYFVARFEGLLTVEDPELFVRKLASGFGSAKAYGFGLMSVARPPE
jgi:CRISPR system Cascade subunit CasE